MNRLTRATILTVACGTFALLGTSEALAQACIGNHAGDRQVSLSAGIGFTDGATFYGASAMGNLRGPVSVGGGYSLVDIDGIDPKGNAINASVAYEIRNLRFSMCPTAGMEYMWVSEEDASGAEATVSSFTIPIGVGFGKMLTAGDAFFVTPFGVPQILYVRNEAEVSDGVTSFEVSDSSAEFGAVLGVLLGTERVFGGGDVSFTTMDNSDPVLSLRLGFVF